MTAPTVNTDLLAYNLNLETDTFRNLAWPCGPNTSPQSLLHELARDGDILTAELVIETGSLINQTDTQGRQPLHEAAFFNRKEMVRFLLQHNARIDAPITTLGHTALYIAIERGHTDTAHFLIEKGAQVNIKDTLSGQGLLHMAAAKGNIPLVGALIAAGIDVLQEDNKGLMARDYAVRYNHEELERILLKLMEHHTRFCH